MLKDYGTMAGMLNYSSFSASIFFSILIFHIFTWRQQRQIFTLFFIY